VLPTHPAADLFPLLEGPDLAALAEDVREHGLIDPIVLHEGQVLDGRNRLRACELAGVAPRFVEWDGHDDPAAWVVSKNLKRRHLDASQRSMVAGRLTAYYADAAKERMREGGAIGAALTNADQGRANLPDPAVPPVAHPGQTFSPPPPPTPYPSVAGVGRARDHAAATLNVSPRTVEHAGVVLDRGVPALIAAVEQGVVAVSAAAEIASLAGPAQSEIVARGEKEIIVAAKRIRAERQEKRRAERMEHLRDIATGNTPLALPARYPVLLADPPWEYEHAVSDTRRIENHYPTMTLDAICALPVVDVVTDDAILFLWVTSPKLEEGMRVVREWGFTYRTSMVWVKDKIGMGYYARQRHELLLIATRGSIPAPAPADRPDSVIQGERTEHSAKPPRVYDLVERMYPGLPRLEMFARAARPGWSAWGNQSSGAA